MHFQSSLSQCMLTDSNDNTNMITARHQGSYSSTNKRQHLDFCSSKLHVEHTNSYQSTQRQLATSQNKKSNIAQTDTISYSVLFTVSKNGQ